MTTRRIKALEGTDKNVRIVDKIIVYDDNNRQIDCCIIHKNEDGKEYYYPSNPHNKLGLFSDLPKDAIECIKNGLGDTLEVTNVLGMRLEHVVRFLDREYGECIRQKSLQGWKNAKFGYGVKFQYLDSLNSGRVVCEDKSLFCNIGEKILVFDTEKEASIFINEINKKAKEYFDEYVEAEKTNTADTFLERIKSEMECGVFSVYWHVLNALDTERDRGCPQYKLKVIQVVKEREIE